MVLHKDNGLNAFNEKSSFLTFFHVRKELTHGYLIKISEKVQMLDAVKTIVFDT